MHLTMVGTLPEHTLYRNIYLKLTTNKGRTTDETQ